MGFFRDRDYTTSRVVEVLKYSPCGKLIEELYHIEYTTTLFKLIRYQEKFFKYSYSMRGSYTDPVYHTTKEKLLKEYSKFLIQENKTRKIENLLELVNDIIREEIDKKIKKF